VNTSLIKLSPIQFAALLDYVDKDIEYKTCSNDPDDESRGLYESITLSKAKERLEEVLLDTNIP